MDALNGGYGVSSDLDPETKASAGLTENEWPYAATPRTIWLAGMPAAVHAFTPLTALPCCCDGVVVHVSLRGAFGPTAVLHEPQMS